MILRTKNERYRKNIKAQEKYHLERIKDEGSLLDNEPELCKEWDYKKNNKTPNNLLTKSNFIVWWKCNKGHEMFRSPLSMKNRKILCDECN
jgi:hypothetical protein